MKLPVSTRRVLRCHSCPFPRSIRVWHRDTGECLAVHDDAGVGDAFSSVAVLGPAPAGSPSPSPSGTALHVAATTIRGRVLVLALVLGAAPRLEVVAATPEPAAL